MKPLFTISVLAALIPAANGGKTWAEPPSFQGLGLLPGATESMAFGVSGDGTVVVGYCPLASPSHEAFRWENGVLTSLGDLPGDGVGSCAYAVSADGAVMP